MTLELRLRVLDMQFLKAIANFNKTFSGERTWNCLGQCRDPFPSKSSKTYRETWNHLVQWALSERGVLL